MEPIKILELFGGVGAPRCALRNLGIDTKSIDYVEIDAKAVASYNEMFRKQLLYKEQSVIGYDLKPDILIHGSPCQDMSIAGKRIGGDNGSGTRSSLMWETVRIIEEMGEWMPKVVVWENVKGVLHRAMRPNFDAYLSKMEQLGYTNTYEVLDAREFGIPQTRERVFVVSVLNGRFDFENIKRQDTKDVAEYLERLEDVPSQYIVSQPSMIKKINQDSRSFGVNIIRDSVGTITCKQMRSPNSGVIDLGDGRYRYLTELECWRLQGYTDEDFYNAKKANIGRHGKLNGALYKQAGNSIPVPVLEALFKAILNTVMEVNV